MIVISCMILSLCFSTTNSYYVIVSSHLKFEGVTIYARVVRSGKIFKMLLLL